MDCQDEPLDKKHLDEISGGDRQFECELMQEFLKATPTLLANMSRAIEQNDLKSLERIAHSLKGSCRSLGANPLSDPCETLEHQAREGKLVRAQDLYQEVRERYAVLSAFVESNWDVKAA